MTATASTSTAVATVSKVAKVASTDLVVVPMPPAAPVKATRKARRVDNVTPLPLIVPGVVIKVDPSTLLVEDDYNVRMFDGSKAKKGEQSDDYRLRESVRFTQGVTNPVTVRITPDGLMIVAGHRRLAAVLSLRAEYPAVKGYQTIPVILATSAKGASLDSRQVRDRDLFVSNSGKALTPWQRAEVAARLTAAGEPASAIAKLANCSVRYVGMLLQMSAFPPAIVEWLQAEFITPTLAAELVKQLDAADFANPVRTMTVVKACIDAELARLGYGVAISVTRSKIDNMLAKLAKETAPAATVAEGEGDGDEDAVAVTAHERGTVKVTAIGNKIYRNKKLWLTVAAVTPEQGAADAKELLPIVRKMYA